MDSKLIEKLLKSLDSRPWWLDAINGPYNCKDAAGGTLFSVNTECTKYSDVIYPVDKGKV